MAADLWLWVRAPAVQQKSESPAKAAVASGTLCLEIQLIVIDIWTIDYKNLLQPIIAIIVNVDLRSGGVLAMLAQLTARGAPGGDSIRITP